MECCGRTCETPFCPFCGKQIAAASPLYSLLAHVRQQLAACDESVKRAEKWAEEEPGNERRVRRAKAKRRIGNKWKAWADALVEVLKQQGATSP